MKTPTRLALFVVAVLFAAVEMRAQESSAVRPRTVTAAPVEQQQTASQPALLTPSVISTRISEAQRMFKTRPKPTAMAVGQIDFVTIAALDRETARTHFITVLKKTFLIKGSEIVTTTSEGTPVTVNIVRANGVN